MLSILFLLVALIAPIASQEECTINCHPGSTCVKGDANFTGHPKNVNGRPFSFHQQLNKDGWHCDCPANMTGIRCNRVSQDCGNGLFCYHGGKCIENIEDTVDSDLLFCDCNDAQHKGVPYVGKYCEVEGATRCGDTDIFCANGGTCVDGFETKTYPCKCPTGHRGPHCEFDTGFVPNCTLQCENSGTCMLGIKDYDSALQSEFWALHDSNFMYCECPEGWFGLKCEVPGKKCGDKTCYNGGSCLQTEHSDGDVEYTCDCSTAVTSKASYAGEFCENESTTYCTTSEDENGKLFCVNGGVCRDEEHLGCVCPEGFHGPTCEYRDSQELPDCRLQCQNGGQCRNGKKDTKLFQKFGDELKRFNETHRLWEHCVCPDGYFGIQCEHKLQICPGGEHVCLHGSKCVPDTTGNGDHYCDCEDGFSSTEKYAGKYCQYTSTDICTKNSQIGVGKGNFAFCVNNGKCKSKVEANEPHPGCTCPDGFKGPHCEFLGKQELATPSNSQEEVHDAKSNGVLVIVFSVALLALVAVVGVRLVKRHVSGIETDTGATKVDPSGPPSEENGVVTDETVDMQTSQVNYDHAEKDLQTVEII